MIHFGGQFEGYFLRDNLRDKFMVDFGENLRNSLRDDVEVNLMDNLSNNLQGCRKRRGAEGALAPSFWPNS